MTADGREHRLGDIAALQSLDGQDINFQRLLGSVSSTITTSQFATFRCVP